MKHLLPLLLSALLPASAAAQIKGEMKEEQLYEAAGEYVKEGLGIDPWGKMKDYVEESITPAEISELKGYLGKMGDYVSTAQQVAAGEFTPLALAELKKQYNTLKDSKRIPAKVRGQLPGLDLVEKLTATIEFAVKMKEAAKANEAAVQAQVFFSAVADDPEFGGPDDKLRADYAAARRVHEKYWGQQGGQIENLLRHQGFLKGNDPGENADPGLKAAYEADVVTALSRLLKMAAEFKEVSRAQWRARRDLQELAAAFGRWSGVAADLDSLSGLLAIEKETETMLPALEKQAAEIPAALAEAKQALAPGGDPDKASGFCSTTQSSVYSARIRLRDFGQKTQKIAQRTRPLLARYEGLYKDVSKFCDDLSAAGRRKEDEERSQAEEAFKKALAEAVKPCSYSGVQGVTYSGPSQAEVDALVAELDALLGSRDGLKYFSTNGTDFDFRELDMKLETGETPDYEAARRSFMTEDGSGREQAPDSNSNPVGSIYFRAVELHKLHYDAREQFKKSVAKAFEEISAAHTKQKEICEKQAADAKPGEDVPPCGYCDLNPAHAVYTRKFMSIPRLNFEAVTRKYRAWERLAQKAGTIARDARLAVEQAVSVTGAGGVAEGPACGVSREMIENRLAEGFSELRGNQSLHTGYTSLKTMSRLWYDWQAGLLASYNRDKAAAPVAEAAARRALAARRQALQNSASQLPAAVGRLNQAAAFLEKTPWYDGKEYREYGEAAQENLRQAQARLPDDEKAINEAKRAMAECPAVIAEVESYAAGFRAAALRLEKIEKDIENDPLLRQIELIAEGRNPKPKYLVGWDGAKAAAAQAKLNEMLAANQGSARRAAPFLEEKIKGMQAAIKTVTPAPADAIVLDDGSSQTLLKASVYLDLEKKAKAAAARGADPLAEGELIKLQAEIEGVYRFEEHEKTMYAAHPVYKAYLAALEACRQGLDKTGKAQAAEQDRLKKEHAALLKAFDTILRTPQAVPGGWPALKARGEKLVRDFYALSGKDRDELGISETDIQQKMADTEKALEDKKQDEADAKALAALKAVHKKAMSLPAAPASAVELDKLLAEAARIAQDAGIDGDMETRELMEELAGKRNSLGASVKPTGPMAGKPTAQDEEDQRVMENAVEDITAEERALAALPGGAAGETAINEVVEKARNIAGNALDSFPKGPGGVPHPNRKPVEDALARLEKAAALRKAGVRQAGGPAAAVPSGPGGLPPAPDASGMEAVRGLYQKFAQAYSSKDLAGVLDLLTEDWESTEGITLADMERTLENSFSVFDSVKMEIQNLQVRGNPDGTFQANYNTLLTGNIKQNDIKHEEKSFQRDTVIMTPQGAKISRTAGNTAWVR